jgi:hypothetical protein
MFVWSPTGIVFLSVDKEKPIVRPFLPFQIGFPVLLTYLCFRPSVMSEYFWHCNLVRMWHIVGSQKYAACNFWDSSWWKTQISLPHWSGVLVVSLCRRFFCISLGLCVRSLLIVPIMYLLLCNLVWVYFFSSEITLRKFIKSDTCWIYFFSCFFAILWSGYSTNLFAWMLDIAMFSPYTFVWSV